MHKQKNKKHAFRFEIYVTCATVNANLHLPVAKDNHPLPVAKMSVDEIANILYTVM